METSRLDWVPRRAPMPASISVAPANKLSEATFGITGGDESCTVVMIRNAENW